MHRQTPGMAASTSAWDRGSARLCLALVGTLSSLALAITHARGAPPRPNVLLICADDHAAYVTGCYGNKQVRTPNIDRLAAAGMRFDRAYCNSPVCTASRAALTTGRYPRSVGVTQLRTPLPDHETTLAELLARAGYDTIAIGKTHFNSDLTHGFDQVIFAREHRAAIQARGGPRPLPAGIDVLPAWRPFREPARQWLNARHLPFGAFAEDMPGTFFAELAADYILQQHSRPFFLYVSFTEPHSPFHFPIEYQDRHEPSAFSVPDIGPEDEAQIPAVFRDLDAKDIQGIQTAYYTSTEFMDRNVGIVLDALERSGQSEHTVVIYLSDHGYLLGQHGRFEKHCSYEQAVRAPLVIRFPGRVAAGSSSEALVELIDILPTVTDLCGLALQGNVQGRSLLPVLERKTDQHRTHVFVEYAPNEEVMVRDQSWKLIYQRGKVRPADGYDTGRPLHGPTLRLFDMENDAGECHNLAAQPEYAQRVEKFVALLEQFLVSTARQPQLIPAGISTMEVLDYCVQPRDWVAVD